MDERQRLLAEINRYRVFRELLTENNAIAAIDELIRKVSDRLARIERRSAKRSAGDV
jgi:hypothetical protein